MATGKGKKHAAPSTATVDDNLIREFDESSERLSVLQVAFQERIAELELNLEDTGWTSIGGFEDIEFTREGLRRIARESRIFFMKNPLVRRAILTQACYCFAHGVTVKARHPLIDEVVQRFMSDKRNRAEFTSPLAMMQRDIDLAADGNLFLALFSNAKGDVRVRAIPYDEISDILLDPDDNKVPQFYVRNGGDGVDVQYYPDVSYRPASQPEMMEGTEGRQAGEIRWDVPMMHVKVNALNGQRFGLSEVYSAQEWARMYNQFLHDFAMVMRAHAKFAWRETVKGGAGQRAAAKAKLDSGISSGGTQTKAAPVAGAVLVETEGKSRLDQITQGQSGSGEDGRRLLLMVSAATGVFEHFFGDPSSGNLATATTMDRPMELTFMARQMLWHDVIEAVCEYVILVAVRSGAVKGVTVQEKPSSWEDEVEAVYSKDPLLEDTELDPDFDADKPIDTSTEVSFPDLVERDMLAHVQAIQAAAAAGGVGSDGSTWEEYITRQLLMALGERSIEETLDELYPEEVEGEEETPPLAVDPGLVPAPGVKDRKSVV